MKLRLSAVVQPLLQVLPTDRPVLALQENEATIQSMDVRVRGQEPVEIRQAVCSVPYASARVEPVPEDPSRRRYTLTLTLSPEAPQGRYSFTVTLRTTLSRQPHLPLNITCEKGIFATPMNVYMGTITPTTSMPVTQSLSLVKRSGRFQIRTASSEDPHLTVTVETLQDGTEYRLLVAYRGGWTPGTIRSRLRIETDDPRQPELIIPVIAGVAGDTSALK